MTIPVSGAVRGAWPQFRINTGTRREILPARRGLITIRYGVLAMGDARSRQLDAVPTTRPVASHRYTSPFIQACQFTLPVQY